VLLVDLAVPPDLEIHELREGIDDREADPMESSGNLVGLIVKLPPEWSFIITTSTAGRFSFS